MKKKQFMNKICLKLILIICLFVLSCLGDNGDKYKVVETYPNGEKKIEMKVGSAINEKCIKVA